MKKQYEAATQQREQTNTEEFTWAGQSLLMFRIFESRLPCFITFGMLQPVHAGDHAEWSLWLEKPWRSDQML